MRFVEEVLSAWQRVLCKHQWVRARWQDGSYGLRCSQCMKPYAHTWNELMARPEKLSPAPVTELVPTPIEPKWAGLRRVA